MYIGPLHNKKHAVDLREILESLAVRKTITGEGVKRHEDVHPTLETS